MKAKGTYSVKKWEENTYEQISSEMKMTKATVKYSISGQIDGKALVEYLMFYKYFDVKDQHKSSANYIGLIRFIGNVGGKEGSFVIEDHGTFENGTASSALQIIAGSGTGELKGMQGNGQYSATQDGAQIELDYNL
jgi:Protein of unknown function (DUF3224)